MTRALSAPGENRASFLKCEQDDLGGWEGALGLGGSKASSGREIVRAYILSLISASVVTGCGGAIASSSSSDAKAGDGGGIEASAPLDFLKDQDWSDSNFVGGRKLSSQEKMDADIAVGRALAARGAPRQCQLALRRAYDSFWKIYGKRIGALVPIDMELNASNISLTAGQQNRIPAEDNLALAAAKPYLYGSVKEPNFNLASFEMAVSLLERLSAGGTE
jgi:hypothetical protein